MKVEKFVIQEKKVFVKKIIRGHMYVYYDITKSRLCFDLIKCFKNKEKNNLSNLKNFQLIFLFEVSRSSRSNVIKSYFILQFVDLLLVWAPFFKLNT